MIKSDILAKIDEEPRAIKEALAFYASFGVTTVNYSAAERERHYTVLEHAGYIEKIGVHYE